MNIMKEYWSEKVYTRINTRFSISKQTLNEMCQQYLIPNNYNLRAPKLNKRMYHRLDAWIAVPFYFLRYGVRFPIHEFVSAFHSFVGIEFAQLVPNLYIHLI